MHPYDEKEYTTADTLLPDLDDYDFANDPAAKLRYEQQCAERCELAEFLRKRAILHGKIQASLKQEVHDRMLDHYGTDFFGSETPTSIMFDGILVKLVQAGVDRSMMVTGLKISRLKVQDIATETKNSEK